MPDAWKRVERDIAKDLGTSRNPNTGEARADINKGIPLSVESKKRKKLPAWLWKAMQQAQDGAEEGQLPVAVLTETSQGKKARRLVVLPYEWLVTIAAALERR